MNTRCAFCGANLEGESTFKEDGKLFCVFHYANEKKEKPRMASCLARYKEERPQRKLPSDRWDGEV